jgi:hypothetical protein
VAADDYVFQGFTSPNYTQVPDELFDELMPRLSETELKVLLYVVRRTFGFKKSADDISLKQMVEGIRRRDGTQLDNGTGLSRPGVTKGVRGLVAKGILSASRNSSLERGDEPTTYRLRMAGDPLETALPGGSKDRYEGGGHDVAALPRNEVTPQETVDQQTEEQNRSKLRTAPTMAYDETRDVLLPYVEDIAREFRDTAPVSSTLTRVVRIRQESGLDDEAFIAQLMRARQITKERTASIRSGEPGAGSRWRTG